MQEIVIKVVGFVALATTIIGLAPQIFKIIQENSASNVSMLMLINYLICSAAWVSYGIIHEDRTVLMSNVIPLMVSVILIGQKIYYNEK